MLRAMPRSVQLLPSLQQLRVFEAVADYQSISAAAKTIHLTQPSVTQAIGHLESRIGSTLFDRRRTGCYLTPYQARFSCPGSREWRPKSDKLCASRSWDHRSWTAAA